MKKLAHTLLLTGLSLTAFCQAPAVLWSKTIGGKESEKCNSVCTDAQGNTFVTGSYYSPSIAFGKTVHKNVKYMDFFIAKYDVNGALLWSSTAGSDGSDEGKSIATDASGNCYVTGSFSGASIKFESFSFMNENRSTDMFIVKYNPAGNVIWAKVLGGNGDDEPAAICTDASGNCFITGTFLSDELLFGDTKLTISKDTSKGSTWADVFIAKFNPSGEFVWTQKLGGTGSENAGGICTDKNGNLYLAGDFISNGLTIGSKKLANAFGFSKAIVVKYDADGNVKWVNMAEGREHDQIGMANSYGCSVACDPSGNIVMSGVFEGYRLSFGGDTLLRHDDGINRADAFVAKYNSDGKILWASNAGLISDDDRYRMTNVVCTDASGNIFLAGTFKAETITFGTTLLKNADIKNTSTDIYLAKYDASGKLSSARQFGSLKNDSGTAMCSDANGNIILGGSFSGPKIMFDAKPAMNAGVSDVYILKCNWK